MLVLVLGGLLINILHEHPLFEDDDEYEEEYEFAVFQLFVLVVVLVLVLGSLPINILQELPLFEHEHEYDDECM